MLTTCALIEKKHTKICKHKMSAYEKKKIDVILHKNIPNLNVEHQKIKGVNLRASSNVKKMMQGATKKKTKAKKFAGWMMDQERR